MAGTLRAAAIQASLLHGGRIKVPLYYALLSTRRQERCYGVTRLKAAAGESRPCTVQDALYFPDLAATVRMGHVPEGLADELPGLYSSLYSTLDWFLTQGGKPPNGACILENPRHVLLFVHDGDTVDVLNRRFACAPEDADRICRALFRTFPHVHRIHLDVMFRPDQLAFPRRIIEQVSHMVIELPATVDEYNASLRKSARRHLRSYVNRARRTFPDLYTETISPGERSQELVDRLIEWKIQRFREQDRLTYWEANTALPGHTAALLRRCGQCRITYIGGKEAVIHLCFRVGDTVFPLEGAHDPSYDAYHLGFLATYQTVCAAIESGAHRVNLLEGTTEYKAWLGARPVPSAQVSVFRSQLSRLRSLDESFRVLRRRSQSAYYELGRRVRRYPGGEALARFMKRRRMERWKRSHPT